MAARVAELGAVLERLLPEHSGVVLDLRWFVEGEQGGDGKAAEAVRDQQGEGVICRHGGVQGQPHLLLHVIMVPLIVVLLLIS